MAVVTELRIVADLRILIDLLVCPQQLLGASGKT
jgi:hypothetical protein